MASTPKIEVELTADATKLKKGLGDAEKAVGQTEKAVGGLGDRIGSLAKDKLGPFGDVLSKLGVDVDGLSAGSMAAAAGIGMFAGFVGDGVRKLGDMTAEVRKFRAASGESWESSSRFVAVMDDLGVSADTGSAAINKLAKAAAGGELEKFGIEAVQAKDGTIDMGATLGVVADAMSNEHDQARKAAMGTALLGKSWTDLNPVLEQGSAGIKDAMAGVKDYQVVTEKSAAEQRKMEMAIDDLQDAVSGLQMAFAKELIPELTKFVDVAVPAVDAANKVEGAIGLLGAAAKGLAGPLGLIADNPLSRWKDGHKPAQDLNKDLGEFGDVAGTAATAAQEQADHVAIMAAHQRDAAAEVKQMTKEVDAQKAALDRLNGVVLTVAGAQIAYDGAQQNLAKSVADVTVKHQAMGDAVNTYGASSAEAKAATDDYNGSINAAEGAANSAATAAVELARQTAAAAGQTFTAEQANIVYRDALAKVSEQTNDPTLQSGMSQLVGLTDSAAAAAGAAAAQYYAMEAAASRAAAVAAGVQTNSSGQVTMSADSAERTLTPQAARAGGGPVDAGVPYLVGEQGPEVIVPQRGGTVIPNDQLGATTINVNVYGAVGDMADVARAIHGELLALERGKR